MSETTRWDTPNGDRPYVVLTQSADPWLFRIHGVHVTDPVTQRATKIAWRWTRRGRDKAARRMFEAPRYEGRGNLDETAR